MRRKRQHENQKSKSYLKKSIHNLIGLIIFVSVPSVIVGTRAIHRSDIYFVIMVLVTPIIIIYRGRGSIRFIQRNSTISFFRCWFSGLRLVAFVTSMLTAERRLRLSYIITENCESINAVHKDTQVCQIELNIYLLFFSPSEFRWLHRGRRSLLSFGFVAFAASKTRN